MKHLKQFEEFSQTFLDIFTKDGKETITIQKQEELGDAIKSGKNVIWDSYIFIIDLEKISCQVFKDAPKSKIGFKNIQHYRYNSIDRMIESLTTFMTNILKYRKQKDDYKQSKKDEQETGRQNIDNIISVGDLLYESWGYEQTNIDFYQVVKVLPASVVIRRIRGEMVDGTEGFMSSNVKPIKDSFIGEEIRKNVKFTKDGYYLPSRHGSIQKYTYGDKGLYRSWYA